MKKTVSVLLVIVMISLSPLTAVSAGEEAKRSITSSIDNSRIELSGLDYVKGQTDKRAFTLTAKSKVQQALLFYR